MKIEGISFINGIWTAYRCGIVRGIVVQTKSYREFRKQCERFGLMLPRLSEVRGMKCEGHYFESGGWRKLLVSNSINY